MAQHDYVIANGTGAAVRSDLNNALAAIVSQNSGPTAPSPTYAYQPWADTTAGLYKIRNAANNAWITLYQLDGEWSTLAIENGSASAPSIYFKDSGTDTGIYSPGADQVAISTAGTGRLFVDSSGRVGLGTSSPAEVLHLGGSAAQNIRINGNTNAMYLGAVGDTTQVAVNRRPTDGTIPNSARGTAFINVNGLSTGGSIELATSTAANTGATTAVTIDSSQRVGIGTTAPLSALDVASARAATVEAAIFGTVGTGVVGDVARVLIRNVNTLGGQNQGVGIGGVLAASASNEAHLTFYSNPGSGVTERARIDSSGRLLVGTSSARGGWYNSSGTSISPVIQTDGTSFNTSSLALSHNENSAGEAARILLGKSRGTTAGSFTVVQNDDDLGAITFQGADGTNFVEGAHIKALVDGAPGADDLPTRLVFATTADGASGPTERMRITSAGKLTHTCNSNTDAVYLENTNASFGNVVLAVNASRNTTNGTYIFIACSISNVAVKFRVLDSGDVQNANNSYGSLSDIKLKENIVDANSQWDDLKALQVRNYNFKEEIGQQTHTQIGLVAQEVELVSPGLVREFPDRDEDGNDLGTVTKSVNYSVLYMKAVKALQEAMERIETLEAEVAALKAS